MLRANKVAGIILATRTQDIHEFTSIDAPLVSIDRIISTTIPYICSENYQGGMMATQHLISRGCRKLAHISGSSFLDMHANKRFEGFRDACLKHNLPYVLMDASEEQFISMKYSEIARHFLNTYPDVDGVFTSNDIIAMQILQECGRKGIAVPQQLKIVGYDDIELASLASPPITTIRQDVDSICRSAVAYIDAQVNGEPAPVGSIFPVSLVIREST
jgi:LacI family sucrose operon transcriptional repressor